MVSKIIVSLLGFVILGNTGCQNRSFTQQPDSIIEKSRYCRPGNAVVFRTTQIDKIDPIRLLKNSEHGCR